MEKEDLDSVHGRMELQDSNGTDQELEAEPVSPAFCWALSALMEGVSRSNCQEGWNGFWHALGYSNNRSGEGTDEAAAMLQDEEEQEGPTMCRTATKGRDNTTSTKQQQRKQGDANKEEEEDAIMVETETRDDNGNGDDDDDDDDDDEILERQIEEYAVDQMPSIDSTISEVSSIRSGWENAPGFPEEIFDLMDSIGSLLMFDNDESVIRSADTQLRSLDSYSTDATDRDSFTSSRRPATPFDGENTQGKKRLDSEELLHALVEVLNAVLDERDKTQKKKRAPLRKWFQRSTNAIDVEALKKAMEQRLNELDVTQQALETSTIPSPDKGKDKDNTAVMPSKGDEPPKKRSQTPKQAVQTMRSWLQRPLNKSRQSVVVSDVQTEDPLKETKVRTSLQGIAASIPVDQTTKSVSIAPMMNSERETAAPPTKVPSRDGTTLIQPKVVNNEDQAPPTAPDVAPSASEQTGGVEVTYCDKGPIAGVENGRTDNESYPQDMVQDGMALQSASAVTGARASSTTIGKDNGVTGKDKKTTSKVKITVQMESILGLSNVSSKQVKETSQPKPRRWPFSRGRGLGRGKEQNGGRAAAATDEASAQSPSVTSHPSKVAYSLGLVSVDTVNTSQFNRFFADETRDIPSNDYDWEMSLATSSSLTQITASSPSPSPPSQPQPWRSRFSKAMAMGSSESASPSPPQEPIARSSLSLLSSSPSLGSMSITSEVHMGILAQALNDSGYVYKHHKKHLSSPPNKEQGGTTASHDATTTTAPSPSWRTRAQHIRQMQMKRLAASLALSYHKLATEAHRVTSKSSTGSGGSGGKRGSDTTTSSSSSSRSMGGEETTALVPLAPRVVAE